MLFCSSVCSCRCYRRLASMVGRVREVDLAASDVSRVLEDCALSAEPDDIAPYDQLVMKRRGPWMQLHRNRAILTELFECSNGFLVHQVSLAAQVKAFLDAKLCGRKAVHNAEHAEKVAYRLRVQMSHVRDHKIHGRRPPQRYAVLGSLLAACRVEKPSSDVRGDDELECEEMQCLENLEVEGESMSSSQCEFLGDLSEATDVEMIAISDQSDTSMDIDRFEAELFTTPQKVQKPAAASPMSEEKTMAAHCSNDVDVIQGDEIEAMLLKKPAAGPTTSEYRGVKKKPAGCKPKAKPKKKTTSELSAHKKRVYSKAYHATLSEVKMLLEIGDAKKKARVAGQLAVQEQCG